MDALTSLYPKLSTGGYLIIDDYMTVPSCRHAAERYWAENQVDGPMELIDSSTVCMRRAA
jgi:O-methyltransferase